MEIDQFAEMIGELKVIIKKENNELNEKTKTLIDSLKKVKTT